MAGEPLYLSRDLFTSGGLTTYDPNGSLTGLTTPTGYSTTAPSWVNENNTGVLGASTGPYGGGGYVAPSYGGYSSPQEQQQAQAEAAYWADQENMVNRQMGQLDPQLNVGLGNIGNSYNLSSNRLGEQFGVARRDYDTGVQNTNQTMLNSRNNVATNTRNRMSALQRLLGIAGSGNSSAATEAAPYAALREGTQNLQGVQQTYGNNRRRLDTEWQDTERSYSNNREDLDRQKYQQENSLRGSIAQTKAGLLDKLATIGVNRNLASGQNYQQAVAARSAYEPQINSLLQQITQLGQQYQSPVMRAGDIRYQAPTLDQYSLTAGRNQGISPQQQPGADAISPLLLPILARREEEQTGF